MPSLSGDAATVRVELTGAVRRDKTEALSALATLLGNEVTPGSYRQWKNQPNADLTSAAGLRDLVGPLINHAQASRALARQMLRISKLVTGDLAVSEEEVPPSV